MSDKKDGINRFLKKLLKPEPLRANKIPSIVVGKTYHNYLFLKSIVSSSIMYRPFQVVSVPVNIIKMIKGNEGIPFEKRRYKNVIGFNVRIAGIVLAGDWDLLDDKRAIESDYTYLGFWERFVEGKEWEKTAYYQNFLSELAEFGGKKGCQVWLDYKTKYLCQWDKLYHEIKLHGYKKQEAIGGSPANEVQIGIARDGECLFFDGIHRVIIAKLLKIDRIPVIVNIWHEKYLDLVQRSSKNKNIIPAKAIEPILNGSLNKRS